MRLPSTRLREAAARRAREEGEPSSRHEVPAPKRLMIRGSSSGHQEAPAVPEVDLTADSPPAGAGAEEARVGAPESTEPTTAEGREEGPPEGPSCPPEGTPAVDPSYAEGAHPRAEPESSSAGDKGKGKLKVPRASVLNDGRWAERLVSSAIVPEVQEELKHLSSAAFYREFYAACARVINSVATTRFVIDEGKSIVREAREEAEAAERALAAARTEHAAEMAEASKRAESEADRARAALDQMARAEALVEARRIRIGELEAAMEQAREAEGRAASEARALEARATAAEAKVAEAEARVGAAIAEFRDSEAFLNEMIETNADAYLQGFRDAKEKVARVFNLPQARDIGVDGPEVVPAEEAPAEETPAEETPADDAEA